MYEIKIIDPCRCAKARVAWKKELVYETIKEARTVALKMTKQGNEKFCKQHSFTMVEKNNTIEISNEPIKK